MRVSPYWKEYKKIAEQYLAINCKMPTSLEADYRAKEYLDSLYRDLHRCADGNAISNATWEFLAKVQETERNQSVSKEMAYCVEESIQELANLYAELKDPVNGFLINANTLSRNGRKRVRESADRIGRLLRKVT